MSTLNLVALRPMNLLSPSMSSRAPMLPLRHAGADAGAAGARREAMLEAALDCIVTMDADGLVVDFNAAAERTFGYGREEARGRRLGDLIVPPELRERHEAGIERHLGTGSTAVLGRRLEMQAMRRDGSRIPVELTVTRTDIDGEPLFIAFLRDLSGLRAAQAALEDAEARLRVTEAQVSTIVEFAPMVLFALDADGFFTLSEGRALELLNLEPGEVVGRSVFDVYAGMPQIAAAVRSALAGQHVSQLMEVGELVFDVTYSPVADRHAGGPAVIGVATDVTSRHRSEQELAHFAFHDRLTGLANRALLEERLDVAVERARKPRTTVALLNLDLDDFKTVNDSLGHAAGDELLCAIARRLEHRVAAAHLLTRHGGDEFMLLLEDLPGDGRAVAEAVAAELLEELRLPFRVGGAALQVGASVGISLYPADALDAADLLKHADAAMYQAKRAGRGRHALYRAADDTATRRLELTGRLRSALAEGQLELHFQPVYGLAGGRISGAEALVRWNDPERGMVSPAEFIPLAEDTGLIEPIGEWVLDAACRQARAWRDAGIELEVGVNASPLELTAPGFAHRVADRMRAHGLGPGALMVEIIESALSEPVAVAPVLARLDELGVRVAIDDFGAGFSSLTRLRNLTVHVLKLDRSFLAGVPEDDRGGAFITAILRLARELDLDVVAEGIETEAQLGYLRGAGAAFGQGFHLARPMPAAELTKLVQA